MSIIEILITIGLGILVLGVGLVISILRGNTQTGPGAPENASQADSAALARHEAQGEAWENERIGLNNRIDDLDKNIAALRQENGGLKAQVKDSAEQKKERERQFESLARKILDDVQERGGKTLVEQNEASMKDLLNPMGSQLKTLKEQLEMAAKQSHDDHTVFGERFKNLIELNHQLSEDAQNLTQALKGDNKVQGDWGEHQLERILEWSGLSEGVHFDKQVTVKDDRGTAHRPDFVIRLPNEKVIVIDSKVSLVAYERWANAGGAEDAEKHRQAHLASMKAQIDLLGSKGYQALFKRSVSYTLLFIPIEPAYMAIGPEMQSLHNYALERGVILVSVSTLLATLKTIAFVWNQVTQNKHIEEIAALGAKIVDSVRLVAESMDGVEKGLKEAVEDFDTLKGRMTSGDRSVMNRAVKMEKLGVKMKTPLPKSWVELVEGDDVSTVQAIRGEDPDEPEGGRK